MTAPVEDGTLAKRDDAGPPEWLYDPALLADIDAFLSQAEEAVETHEPRGDAARVDIASNAFADRVASRHVDLLQRIRDGIPAADYLPASDGMLRRGKRHYWVAPKKVGKSIGGLVHAVDIVLSGGQVVIFDRENGGDLYAARLDAIIAGRQLDRDDRGALSKRLRYFEFPRFHRDDQADLVALCAATDLVIFDSQRMYLADLGLEENSSDDYAEFMALLIEPLFRVGIATLILDNAGHQEPKRGRGASSKGDLNEILFALEAVGKFDLDNTGELRLEITDSRFGNTGRWTLEIGGGVFGHWQRTDQQDPPEDANAFRPTGLMERVSIFLEHCTDAPTRREITDAVTGKSKFVRIATDVLVREGYARGRKGEGVKSIRPYREADDPRKDVAGDTDRVPDASHDERPDRVPGASPSEPPSYAESEGASPRVPGASPGASHTCVPAAGSPYGEPPAASPPLEHPPDRELPVVTGHREAGSQAAFEASSTASTKRRRPGVMPFQADASNGAARARWFA